MSSRPTALSVSILLFVLRVQRIDSTEAAPIPSRSGFQPPEVDGSAVDEPCRIFPVPTPSPATPSAPPDSRKQVTATPKKPAVQPPPRKPISQNTGAPIRKQPAPGGPITNSLSTPGSHLLYYLLANSRWHPDSYALAGYWLLPGNRLVPQPIGGMPRGAYGVTSRNKQLLTALLKRAGKPYQYTHPANYLSHTHRRKIDSSSSEESDSND